jgi:hypothetical protein
MEISITEMILFAWGATATGYAVMFRERWKFSIHLLSRITEDPTLYAQLHDGWMRHQKHSALNKGEL